MTPGPATAADAVRELDWKFGGGDWLRRLEFTVVESRDVPLGAFAFVDAGMLQISVVDLPAFREALDWHNLDLDVRGIFNDRLRALARRFGVEHHPIRRTRYGR